MRADASIIARPLSQVLNLSLIQGTGQQGLYLFMKIDRTEVDNYRPVSNLTIISKIFERVKMIKFNHTLIKKTSLPISVRFQE